MVEDESATRRDLLVQLKKVAPSCEVSEAATGDAAVRLIASGRFDAVFLDVALPGVSGMDLARVLARLESPPAIVFVTAYDLYAVDAFGLGAVDYLLKPCRPERLAQAVERIVARGAQSRAADEVATIEVELAGRTVFLRREEVRFVRAHGDYVRLFIESGSHLLRQTLSELERAWSNAGFLRTHRSYLVNLHQVTQLHASTQSGLMAITDVGKVPVSRRHARTLRSRLMEVVQEGQS
ncbi:LytR/AlgR family response regulator transcription factor [Haloglycomyces albus]|uniref:LytR/AlgR family response regulator transcription factor n=1 Tax=Haloglycomyces albus TaxID=526067 RepID=UPI001B7FB91A|nr:LytTR family DNA-binding domain-containing protein [Haloglycomyces albus]